MKCVNDDKVCICSLGYNLGMTEVILCFFTKKVIFNYRHHKSTQADNYIARFKNFCKVFDEYIDYVTKNKIVLNLSDILG